METNNKKRPRVTYSEKKQIRDLHLDGYSQKEICEMMKRSPNAVSKVISKVRQPYSKKILG